MTAAEFSSRVADARLRATGLPLPALLDEAAQRRDAFYGPTLTYSPKVFIPLTELCRDVCHYCTFAKAPRALRAPYLEISEVLELARQGEAAGCREALFTLGDKPERRFRVAADWLAARGYASTTDYLAAAANAVLRETGLLPHINAGTLSRAELTRLRDCSASMGIMLESGAAALLETGRAHHGSPDKRPWRRLATLVRAGRLRIPMTTGLLVGIGETREDRIRDLVTIQRLHERYGHIQEVIIQNFRAKAGTRMALAPEPDSDEHCWTIAMARLILDPEISVQAPPNLSPGALPALIAAGLNDWGGISPVTPDHVNPEAPWPGIDELSRQSAGSGKRLLPRLTVYPGFLRRADRWLSPALRGRCLALIDSDGFLRDSTWLAGLPFSGSAPGRDGLPVDGRLRAILDRLVAGGVPDRQDIVRLFQARGGDFGAVLDAADELRREQVGDTVTFVVNRNINYTNVCQYACGFCAFSKRTAAAAVTEAPYDIDGAELLRRAREAWDLGATEVCLQGGIHPDYSGHTYLEIVRTLRQALPDLHVHAFSPLEIVHGARTLGLSYRDFLALLRDAGLNSLPGTAAEIFAEPVRARICPDKLTTQEWLEVMRAAHEVGLGTTSTMMFGHVDDSADWADHLLTLRELQAETGGFREFVPLPFVAGEAPLARRGECRHGPTLREAMLVHAVSRLVLGRLIPNIQTSWVKMGRAQALACLSAGANDLGGTLINESITRAAGASHGQWWSPRQMLEAIEAAGRKGRIRRTDYGIVQPERAALALESDGTIAEPINFAAGRRSRSKHAAPAATGRG